MKKAEKEELLSRILAKWIAQKKISKKLGREITENDIKKAGIKQKVKDRLGV